MVQTLKALEHLVYNHFRDPAKMVEPCLMQSRIMNTMALSRTSKGTPHD